MKNALFPFFEGSKHAFNHLVGGAMDNDVVERTTVFPLAKYSDGQVRPAWPGMIAGPVEAWNRMLTSDFDPSTASEAEWDAMARDSFDAASLAPVGGVAAGAMGAVPEGALASNGWKPKAAALKLGDRIFEGVHHGEAYENAVAALGEKAVERLAAQNYDTGFVTHAGEYLTREQAAERVGKTEVGGSLGPKNGVPYLTAQDGFYSNSPDAAAVPLGVQDTDETPRNALMPPRHRSASQPRDPSGRFTK